MTGIEGVIDVVRGAPAHPVPVAQGPELDEETGQLRIRGPFTISRHPLNLAPLVPFWLTPHLTTRRLAFNLVGTAYLILGSFHEERRLGAVYGEEYSRYRASSVPFYLPGTRHPARPNGEVTG